MHCEIIDCYFNVFFIEIQPKKENFKCFLSTRVWTPKLIYWPPKKPEYITVKIQNPFFFSITLTEYLFICNNTQNFNDFS